MKKLILKTAFITLGVCVIFLLALFGILSLASPATMMNFTASIGLTGISGDYAYQEYERSGNMDCLARSFIIAAERGEDRKANERFETLIADESFEEYCREVSTPDDDGIPAYDYRGYLYGQAARVKYRLAKIDEAKAAVIEFAIEATDLSFPAGNPTIMLAVEAAYAKDVSFCRTLLEEIRKQPFDTTGIDYQSIVIILSTVEK